MAVTRSDNSPSDFVWALSASKSVSRRSFNADRCRYTKRPKCAPKTTATKATTCQPKAAHTHATWSNIERTAKSSV